MDTHGARELAKRIADEERRRAEAGQEPGADEATQDADPAAAAVDRLREEVASLKAELVARDDSIERLRIDLTELRTKLAALEHEPGERGDGGAPAHLLFVTAPSSSYRLVPRQGRVPGVGSEVVLDESEGGRHRVSKIGPSPLPDDPRRCAFLEALP